MKLIAPILILLIYANNVYAQADHCVLKKEDGDLRVYVCRSGNEKLKSIKAEFNLPGVTIAELAHFIRDVERFTAWQYQMIRAETLNENENEISYISEIDAPWPATDRELVVKMQIKSRNENYLLAEVNNFPTGRPVKEGFLRVPFIHGTWSAELKADNSLQCQYLLRVNPGGSVPAWLVNMAIADGPYISFKNLKQMLRGSK